MDFKRVKRILIYRLGSLGDTVVALPALHLIERAFPNAQRILLTNQPVHAKAPAAFGVLAGSGLVQGFIHYPVAMRNIIAIIRVWWQIMRFRPEVAVYLTQRENEYSIRRDAWFFRMCGVRRVVGLPNGESDRPLHNQKTDMWEHESSRLTRRLRNLGDVDLFDPANWDLRLTLAETQKAEQLLAPLSGIPLIACGPGTKMQSKDWGQENWRELLTRLGRQMPRHGLLLVGAKEDAPVSDYVSATWRGPVVNLCGILTPRETAAVLRYAELFLGPDSGPMHLAASYGVPCAIAYASRSHRGHWFPFGEGHQVVYHTMECSPCGLEVCIERKRKCLTSISVEEMASAAVRAWNNGRARPTALLGA